MQVLWVITWYISANTGNEENSCHKRKRQPELSNDQPPREVLRFREKIRQSDGVLICTPEYVFSLPAGLKNALEWCVSSEVFAGKPAALITAAASGDKGHEALQLIMQTLMARFTPGTTLLIKGIRSKVDEAGNIVDRQLEKRMIELIGLFDKEIS
ncbi:MAG: NADPH-dependent FMN reductase [Flavihumibacter sp.]